MRQSAFSARLLYREVQIEAGYGHHAVVLIHYNHAAGTHHGTFSKQVVEVYRGIQMLLRQAAARRTSGLHSLELLAAFDAAAYFVDYFAEGGSHRNLYQSYVIYFSCKGKTFVPLENSVPIVENHSAPRVNIIGMLASVSTLFTLVGLPR